MHSTYLPVWLWVLGSHHERCTQDRRPRPMVFAKVVGNQIVPSRAEWRGETDNRATTPVGYCPSTASFSVRPYCKNARRGRCQEYHNCFPFGELEKTTSTSSNYVDEDYPARPEIKQSLPGWGDNCGSESSTLETNVCVWCYAPLVVLATQKEERRQPVNWSKEPDRDVMKYKFDYVQISTSLLCKQKVMPDKSAVDSQDDTFSWHLTMPQWRP